MKQDFGTMLRDLCVHQVDASKRVVVVAVEEIEERVCTHL